MLVRQLQQGLKMFVWATMYALQEQQVITIFQLEIIMTIQLQVVPMK